MTSPLPAASPSAPPVTRDPLSAEIDALLARIHAARRVLVCAHHHPDGDAVGSTLACAHMLDQLGKEVIVYNSDPIPYNFTFLPGADRWTHEVDAANPPDLTIVLDCAEPSRVGAQVPEAVWAGEVAVVDHHKTWDAEFASVYVRDVAASATGELLYRIATQAGLTLTKALGECLYCCLMTDTGSFRYSSTSASVFRAAAALLEAGVDPWHMTSHIYESQPRQRLELLSRVLSTLRFSPCERLAFVRIDRAMLDATGADLRMTDGFINFARSVQGVEVAIQLTESDEQAGRWYISLRGRGRVDVSALARQFGGGGHHNAAGCAIDGDPATIEAQFAEALDGLL